MFYRTALTIALILLVFVGSTALAEESSYVISLIDGAGETLLVRRNNGIFELNHGGTRRALPDDTQEVVLSPDGLYAAYSTLHSQLMLLNLEPETWILQRLTDPEDGYRFSNDWVIPIGWNLGLSGMDLAWDEDSQHLYFASSSIFSDLNGGVFRYALSNGAIDRLVEAQWPTNLRVGNQGIIFNDREIQTSGTIHFENYFNFATGDVTRWQEEDVAMHTRVWLDNEVSLVDHNDVGGRFVADRLLDTDMNGNTLLYITFSEDGNRLKTWTPTAGEQLVTWVAPVDYYEAIFWRKGILVITSDVRLFYFQQGAEVIELTLPALGPQIPTYEELVS